MLMPEGVNRDYSHVEDTQDAPLARKLFERFAYITRVFYMSNFVTVTKRKDTDWYEVIEDLRQFIKSYLESGGLVYVEQSEVTQDNLSTEGNDVIFKIKGILDEYIRPAVEMDGGAIAFHSFEQGTVKVLLQGSCSGCPSSTITLKAGIENLLKRMIPEVQEVVAEGT